MSTCNLFLHIGTEKTGSSYIQSLFALNREQLLISGIYYPVDHKWEKEMLAGRISPGNGESFLYLLKNNDWKGVKEMFSIYSQACTRNSCHSILISNENLIEPLSTNDQLKKLMECCRDLVIDSVQFLLVLRDPVEQAISLYKHRAKSGKVNEAAIWLKQDYKLPFHLSAFFEQASSIGIDCIVKRYKKSSLYLTKLFFLQWLGVDWPSNWKDTIVNPSLSFSELALLSKLRTASSSLVPLIYQRFLSIPNHIKSDDVLANKYYEMIFNSELYQFIELWHHCNRLLGDDLLLVPSQEELNSDNQPIYSFTAEQLGQIGNGLAEYRTLHFYFRVVKSSIRSKLASVKYFLMRAMRIHP